MRTGRPKEEKQLYAESLGFGGRAGVRAIERLGGPERLQAMSEEARELMLSLAKKSRGTRPDRKAA